MAWARVAPWLLPLPAIAIIGREVLVPKSLLLGRCNALCLVVSIKILASCICAVWEMFNEVWVSD
jgi:hypothetical protein